MKVVPQSFEFLIRLVLLAILLSLGACGGGGAGGGNGGPSVSLSTNNITFTATSPGAYVAPQTVKATVAGVNGGALYYGINYSGPAISSISDLTVTSSTTGEVTVYPASSATLGTGTFTSTITVIMCVNDPTCATGELAGSPQTINVTYQIGGIVTSPSAINLSAVEGSAAPSPASLSVSLPTGSGSLTTSVAYSGNTTGWLSITPATATPLPATLAFNASALPAGTYSATVTLSAGGYSLPIPVSYTVAPPLQTSASSASFAAVSGQSTLPTAKSITVSSPGSITGYSTSVSYGTGASGWLDVAGSSVPGTLTLVPNTTNLSPGMTYSATVALNPNGGGTPTNVDVSYAVATSLLTVSPASQSFSIDAASPLTDAYLKRTVTTGDTGAPLSWTASSSASWLTVTGSGVSGDTATLTLVPSALASLPQGLSTATITFTYNGSGGGGPLTKTLDATINLNLPKIDFVAPYVASANTSANVILRGSGFSSLTGQSINFGSTPVASYTVVSDSEIRIAHPALAAGNYPLQIGSAANINVSHATLVVVNPPVLAAATLAYPNGAVKRPLRAIYDAERKTLIVAVAYPAAGSDGDILSYTYSGSSWAATPLSKFVPTFYDLSLSTDGQKLIALSQTAITQFDPVTLTNGTVTNASFGDSYVYLKNIAMTNNGTALITTGYMGSGYTTFYGYPFMSPAITRIPSAGFYFGSSGVSLDGSSAIIIQGSLSPAPEVTRYDASTGTLSSTGVMLNQDGISRPSLDRSGSRVLLNSYLVYDANFVKIGNLSCGGGLATSILSPDGTRAYCANGATLHTYDLTATPVAGLFPEIGAGITLAGNPGARPQITTSPDGGTIFVAGPDAIVVQPAP